MTRNRFCVGAGLIAAFVGGIAVGRSALLRLTAISPVPAVVSRASAPEDFLIEDKAIGLPAGADDARRSELLQMVAMRRQLATPNSANRTWIEIREGAGLTDSQSVSPEKSATLLPQLIAYEEILDNTLEQCDSVADFREVWQVRQSVEGDISRLRKTLLDRVQDQAPVFETPAPPSTIRVAKERLERFAAFVAVHETDFVLLASTISSASGDDSLKRLSDYGAILTGVVNDGLAHEKMVVQSFREALGGEHAQTIEPADSASVGNIQAQLQGLNELRTAIAAANLEIWRDTQGIVTPANESRAATDTQSTATASWQPAIDTLEAELRAIQAIAYNFWALREIEAAEASDNWDGRLAGIEPGLLEPVVSSMYSSVFARRLDEVKDPERRSRFAQRLLNSPRVGLTAF